MIATRPTPPPELAPWITALRELCRRGWSNAKLSEVLSALSLPALLNLRDWSKGAVEAAAERSLSHPRPGRRQKFNRQRVIYCRQRYQIPRGKVIICREGQTPADRLRLAQTAAGFDHLLPAWDQAQRAYVGGILLRPREVLLVTLLRDNGEMDEQKLAALVRLGGFRSFRTEGRDARIRLIRAGILRRRHLAGSWHYRLTEQAEPPEALSRQTDPEER